MQSVRIVRLATACGVAAALTFGAVLVADHSWGGYHWARTTASFNLTIVNSTTSDWDPYVSQAIGRLVKFERAQHGRRSQRIYRRPGIAVSAADPQAPSASAISHTASTAGWVSRGFPSTPPGTSLPATRSSTTPISVRRRYNQPDWKQSVACQELGHNIGLYHQDEDFDNVSLESCMDYQDPPWRDPQRPRLGAARNNLRSP